MPEDVLPQPTAIGASQEILDLIPRIPLLPGESRVEFEDLRRRFFLNLRRPMRIRQRLPRT